MRGGRIVLYALGLLFSVAPPLFATLAYFPVWSGRGGGAMLSGMSALLLLLCFAPLMRFIKERLRSPSAPIIWLIVFIIFFILAEIAAEMKVIAFTGLVGNLIGTGLFRLAGKGERKSDDEGI